MPNIGKIIVEKYCIHQGYGNYSVDETKLIEAINKLCINCKKPALPHDSPCNQCLYYLTCNSKDIDKKICHLYDNEP